MEVRDGRVTAPLTKVLAPRRVGRGGGGCSVAS